MLLYKLTPEQRQAFLGLIRMLAKMDQAVAPMEARVVREITEEIRLGEESDALEINIQHLPILFASRESRVIVMIELARLAGSDTIICIDERRVISNIAQILGFTKEELGHIIALSQAHESLRHGIRRLSAF